ncbi:hypothetical protein NDU88_003639 [Pleurodeles waltl]|uniref:Uncharacterized protein n=1 Tax=Pleurodeles waltl TaxID=8319 RepID=A0AAV7L6H0_PLEWA|nr:hypothetical protein NDU88_003639 [Pleurodeles waltl]
MNFLFTTCLSEDNVSVKEIKELHYDGPRWGSRCSSAAQGSVRSLYYKAYGKFIKEESDRQPVCQELIHVYALDPFRKANEAEGTTDANKDSADPPPDIKIARTEVGRDVNSETGAGHEQSVRNLRRRGEQWTQDTEMQGAGIGSGVPGGREPRENQDGSRNQRDGAGSPPTMEDAVRDRLTPGNTAENSTRGATDGNVGPDRAEAGAWRCVEVKVSR